MDAITKMKAEQAKALKDIEGLERLSGRNTLLDPWFSATRRCTAPSDFYEEQIEDYNRAREKRDIVLLIRSSSRIRLPDRYPKPLMRCGAQLFRRLAHAIATADGITEVLHWYNDFEETVRTKGPTAIAHSLVQLGVETASCCECAEDFAVGTDEIDMSWPAIWWLHHNHRLWNTAIHDLLVETGKLQAVRSVLRRDVKIDDAELKGFGRIVLKEYGQKLLAHFLKTRPDEDWVDIEVTDAYTPADSSAA